MLREILGEIERRERFVVTSHARPDGDAIGSVLACSLLLQSLGKQVDAVMADGVPLIYRTLPHADLIQTAPRLRERYDAAIVLECDGLERTRLKGLDGHFLINIDHHASGRPFADLNWIDTDACAVAEMVYELTRAAGVTVTPAMATNLYTAVLTDTGSFCFEGTDDRTFALAEELVRRGAEPARIAQDVYFSNPTSKMRLLGAALTNLHREGRMAWMWVTQADMERTGAAEEDCEGLVNYAIGISGVEVAVFLRELPDHRLRLSLRSKRGIDVARVAEHFGGGGHECASGCTLEGPLAIATERILQYLRGEVRKRKRSVAECVGS